MYYKQTVSDDPSGLVISLQLIPNYELVQTILSYGAEVKALDPLSRQQQLRETIRKSFLLYEPMVSGL